MPNVIIYHNPKCSKSRQTLALIEESGLTPTVVKYLETPLTAAEIKSLLKKLGISARELIRKKEKIYSELNLSDTALSDQALIQAMAANPILIERPIVIHGNKACLGRPPENVLEIL